MASSGRPKAGAGRSASPRGSPPQRVRIIGGQWRRSWLAVPDVDGLRPTPDRVRETLFNWLGQDLSGLHCLDLFAGTGALGLEAASRGAADVLLIETHPKALAGLEAAIERLKAAPRVRLQRADALEVLARLAARGERVDLVFIDPPFRQGFPARVLPLLPAVLTPRAWVYLESESPLGEEQARQWLGAGTRVLRQGSAGQVHYHLLAVDAEVIAPTASPPVP